MYFEASVFVSILLLVVLILASIWYFKNYITLFLQFRNVNIIPYAFKYFVTLKEDIPITHCKYIFIYFKGMLGFLTVLAPFNFRCTLKKKFCHCYLESRLYSLKINELNLFYQAGVNFF